MNQNMWCRRRRSGASSEGCVPQGSLVSMLLNEPCREPGDYTDLQNSLTSETTCLWSDLGVTGTGGMCYTMGQNTQYFQSRATHRKRKNTVRGLRREDGSKCS